MLDINEILSKENQEKAFEHFATKKDGRGADGVFLSDLREYWKLNHDRIEEEIKSGKYCPGIIRSYEITNGYGKRRTIVSLNTIDRYITRLMAQKMKFYIEPEFLNCSYAYQEGKGIRDAVERARNYIESGFEAVVEIDLKDYFDNISIGLLLKKIKKYITDYAVLQLLESYLYCKISCDGEILKKRQSIVQGNSISPILSNVYLHDFDQLLQKKSYCWLRYSDNIFIYAEDQDKAEKIYSEVCGLLEGSQWQLKINYGKSGVYADAVMRKVLGYKFNRRH